MLRGIGYLQKIAAALVPMPTEKIRVGGSPKDFRCFLWWESLASNRQQAAEDDGNENMRRLQCCAPFSSSQMISKSGDFRKIEWISFLE
jgi:hypothetical protein